jgi:hypothetical protein
MGQVWVVIGPLGVPYQKDDRAFLGFLGPDAREAEEE